MLHMLTDRVGVVPGGTNVGVIRTSDTEVVLVDSGLNDTTARKVLRVVRDGLGSEPIGIINTHGHADHFGANAWLLKRVDCRVAAPAIDAATIAHPILQPSFLFGGADPMDALRNKFLLAESSPVHETFGPKDSKVLDVELDVVGLEGHSPGQCGFVVDGVFFCADVVFPEVAIEKYRIPYLFGLTDHLAALATAESVGASVVVPGHGPVEDSIDDLVRLNRGAIERTSAAIIDALHEATTGDDLCGRVFSLLEVPVSDAQSYFLLRPTINAYLGHLERSGEIGFGVEGGRALWFRR